MELADVLDSKSSGGDTVRVRPPLPAPKKRQNSTENRRFLFLYTIVTFSHKKVDYIKINTKKVGVGMRNRMAMQNVYDNEIFFEDFKKKRINSTINFNDCIETPILLAMLPDLHGKSILDIGCGMGQHAKQYSDMGAKSVLGIDISDKMLEYARKNFCADNITYHQMALEDICGLDQIFDLVTSSLVFDYVQDFDELLLNVYALMKDDAEFVFSMSHPMATAYDGKYPRYTRSESGERLYANINNYFVEGQRKITWVVDDYELYHRTFSSILNSLINAGFLIEECQESQVADELRTQYPDMFGGTIHRPDFVFFRCKKAM